MAYYRYDWEADALASEPAGFTKLWNTSNTTISVVADAAAPKGKSVRITRSSNNRALLAADGPSADADRNIIKQRALVRLPPFGNYSSTTPGAAWLVARASGSAGSETGYTPGFDSSGSATTIFSTRWAQYISGSPTLDSIDPSLPGNTAYWLVLEINGSSQAISAYAADDYALATPLISRTRTDTAITQDGWVGLGGFTAVSTPGEETLFYDVATGTDELPLLVPEGVPVITGITPGSTTAEVTYTTDNVWAGTSYEYRVDGGAWQAIGASPATISGLTQDTTYNTPGLELRAINSAGGGSASDPVTFSTTAVPVIKGVRVQLFGGSSEQSSITGITAMWWDASPPTGNPVFTTATASTDASGWLELDIHSQTSLDLTDPGHLMLFKVDATEPDDSLGWQGRLLVQDVS